MLAATAFQPPVSYTFGDSPDFAALADFNGDGNPDMVVSSYAGSQLSVRLGRSDGTFQAASDIPLSTAPDYVGTADLNRDGKADLIAVHFDNNTISVLLGNGNGTFQGAISYAAGTGPRAFVAGDFNGDGFLDLVMAKTFDKNLTLLRGRGDGTFQAPLNYAISHTPTLVAAGDFNGDGKLDLGIADFYTDKACVFLGNGSGAFQSSTPISVGAGPSDLAAGDFNGDGKLDLVTANFFGNNVSVLRGNGDGTLQTAANFSAGSGATFVAVVDLNRDGKLDLAVANANADNITVLVGNGSGSFAADANFAVGDSPRAIAAGQLNGDQFPDLVVTNQGSNTVTVLLAIPSSSSNPVANAGGPYNVNEGGSVVLNGSGSTGTSLTYAWDLDGDGIFGETGSAATRGNETGVNPTFLAAGLDGPSSRTIWLRVTNSSGSSHTATGTVNVANVAPTLTISGNNSVNEGSTYTLNLSSSDPGPDTIIRWTINWGDGQTQVVNGNPSSVTKVYADNGSYTITATATDEDGTWNANSKLLTVNNVAPTLTISGPSSTSAGAVYTLNLSASDPGADTITRWVINWGDGVVQTVTGNPSSVGHTYLSGGVNRTISATATDEDGTWSSNSLVVSIVVTDTTHPTASANAPSVTTPGETSYVFTVTYSDDVGINTSFLDNNDILVTGPGGFSQLATFVSWVPGSGNSVIATYRITPPGGSWDWPDNGTYTLAMQRAQVRDTTGNSVRHGTLRTFQVAIGPPDLAGNTLATAFDLGAMTAGRIKAMDDWCGALDRNDFYKFTIESPVTFSVKLYNLTDNADLMLLDSAGNRILYAKRSGTSIESFTRSMTPGTYYLRVLFAGTVGTNYRLRVEATAATAAPPPPDDNSISTAVDAGTINPGTIRVFDQYVGPDDRNDFYRITITQPTRIYVKLTGMFDNADLMLLDSAGNRIAYSKRGGSSDEYVQLDLAPGTYFARVLFAGAIGTTYRLRLEGLSQQS